MSNLFYKQRRKMMDDMCDKIINHQMGFEEYISEGAYAKLDVIREAFKELVKTEGEFKALVLLLTDLHSSSLLCEDDVGLWSRVI